MDGACLKRGEVAERWQKVGRDEIVVAHVNELQAQGCGKRRWERGKSIVTDHPAWVRPTVQAKPIIEEWQRAQKAWYRSQCAQLL